MSSQSLGSTFYHGGDESTIEALVTANDFEPAQDHDHGFFGDGIFVTRYPEPAQEFGDAIAEVRTLNSAQVFPAGETFGADSIVPQAPPSWHADFCDWVAQRLADDWTGDWDDTIRPQLTPGTEAFDRTLWYELVAAYAAGQNYPLVYWTDTEILIRDTSIITNCTWYTPRA